MATNEDKTIYPTQGADALNVAGFTTLAGRRVVVLSIQKDPDTTFNINLSSGNALELVNQLTTAAGY